MASRAVPLALSGALGAGIVLSGVSLAVRHQVTSDRFYLDALEQADVYQRVYEEVAADPELARLIDPLFGNFRFARALTVSTLRLVVPPQSLRRGAEALVSGWTAYLRGERDSWPPRVDVDDSEILARTSSYLSARIASATALESANTAVFQQQVEGFLGDLLAGRVPTVVPSLPPLPEPEAQRIATLVLARAPVPPPPGAREQIAIALAAGDTHEALALAAPLYLDPALRQTLGGWRERLEESSFGDVVRSLARPAPGGVLVTTTSSVRSAVRWLGTPLAILSGLMACGSFAGLLWLLPRRDASPTRWLGGTLTVTGMVGVATLVVGSGEVEAVIDERIAGLPPELPRSLVALVSDVAVQMVGSLRSANMPLAVALILAGAALLVSHPPKVLVHLRRSEDRERRVRVLAGGVSAAVLVLLAVELWGERSAAAVMLCNGHAELCDRRLDEVVFAGTHNSMSAASLGWIFPNQDRSIEAQLEAGYRALLIDIHYWGRTESIQRHLTGFPPAYRTAALDALARASVPRPGVFLCHGLCGLGATPLAAGLEVIADFLRRNPHEVVILSLEDYAMPEDVAEAFRSSGLLELVHEPEGSDRWPTLGEMIESGRRVVVLADHHGGRPSWYLPFGEYTQDTPGNVRSPEGFTCKRNRGDPNAPLLLINHWISTLPPDRVSAFRVNRRESLMAHVERCRQGRGLEPTVIAVDFSSIGDALRVTDELNAARE